LVTASDRPINLNKFILSKMPQNGNGVAEAPLLYPITGMCNRCCGKVFSGISKIHYTSGLV
jgi:hypothetical protein